MNQPDLLMSCKRRVAALKTGTMRVIAGIKETIVASESGNIIPIMLKKWYYNEKKPSVY